jgi:PAS domain S-box-containing protein
MNFAYSTLSPFGLSTRGMRARLYRYAFAFVAVVAATSIRYTLGRYWGVTPTYITFYPTVMFVAVLAGLGPGLLATLLSASAAMALFLVPQGTPYQRGGELIALFIFVLMGASISLVAEAMRRRNVELDNTRSALESVQAQSLLAAIVVSAEDAIIRKDLKGIIQTWNPSAERLFGYRAAEIIGRPVNVLFPPGLEAEESAIRQRLSRGERIEHFESLRQHKDGCLLHVSLTISPIKDHAGNIIGASKIVRDLTHRKRTEGLLAIQTRLLEMIATSVPLNDTLCTLVRLVELQFPGLLCSFFLLDKDGRHLRHCAAPSLPESYIRAIDGLAIGPHSGSCGTAMYRKERVIVTDILEDLLWEDFRELATTHGLRACWSSPILSHQGNVLGSFAIHSSQPRAPIPAEEQLIDFCIHLAGIAIERSRNELALRESEERYRSVVAAMAEGVLVQQADGAIIACNRSAERALSVSPGLLLGRTFADWQSVTIHEDGSPFLPKDHPVTLALHVGKPVSNLHMGIKRPDDSISWLLINAEPMFHEAGETPYAAVVTFSDDTARFESERQLRNASLHARSLIEASLDSLVTIGTDGKITDVNAATAEVTGVSSLQLIGTDFANYFTEPEKAREAHRLVLSRGFVTDYLLTFLHAQGRLTDVLYNASLYKDTDGRVRGVFAAARDITDRKRMEKELELNRAQAVSSARLSAIGLMAGSIAHEINNPLAIIHASASDLLELADSQSVSLGALQAAGARIKKTADRIARIVNSLRQISREGTADPFQRASVADIVRQALELCSERFRVNSIRLDLSPVDPALFISCREVQVAQVLLNLLQNAFDAAADLPSDRWVRLDVSAQNHSVVFSVSDNGPGVPPEIKSRIMEPFFTTKPVGKGTGLGLSLSRTIVEEHGGQLKLDDSPANTTFSFSIPLLMEEKNATQERYNIARR